MEVILRSSSRLAPGTAAVPGRPAGAGPLWLRLGSAVADVTPAAEAADGELLCAPDVWTRLAIPYEGLRLQMRETAEDELELGPTVTVLYPGQGRLPEREVEERAAFYYGHLAGRPGLYAISFDETIDWEQGAMRGYVIDNRSGRRVRVCQAEFPITATVRLTWSILREVIGRLREITGNRTFNWLRSMNKWTFHRLLSEAPGVADHLPETRKLRGAVDLAAMLARRDVIFVKHVHGIKGTRALRIRQEQEGFEVTHMHDGKPVRVRLDTLDEVLAQVRVVAGTGTLVAQQGIATTGLQGTALHFRVVTVREPGGAWRVLVTTASVASDPQVPFSNQANGARDESWQEALVRHYGMEPGEAEACHRLMCSVCLEASGILAGQFDPLGMLGFDVVVDTATRQTWLLEANPVPGWNYDPPTDRELARSQIAYALALTGFPSE